MIRNMLICITVFVFCSFMFNSFTVGSQSGEAGMEMYAIVSTDDRRVLFNDWQEFYDKHTVEIHVLADKVYDGMYVGNCFVTGNSKRDERFLGNGGDTFYLGGASDTTQARLVFEDNPNQNLDGDGWGWCKINGSMGDFQNYQRNETEDSKGFNFDPPDGDNTPDCPGCTDANPDCPHAGDRHHHPPPVNFDEIFKKLIEPTNGSPIGISSTNPNQSPSPGESYAIQLITDTPYSQVYWYVKAPWETSYYGTNVEIDSGDGSTTEASLSYTFPSGAMHTGDFIITAYIYRSDQSVYEETYTVNVTMP